jgi:hypothetical protein
MLSSPENSATLLEAHSKQDITHLPPGTLPIDNCGRCGSSIQKTALANRYKLGWCRAR